MRESFQKQFATPQEEIAYLRDQIAQKERALSSEAHENNLEKDGVGIQELREYGAALPHEVLAKGHQLSESELAVSVEQLSASSDPVGEILELAESRGIHNALSVLEKSGSAHTSDEVHRRLVEMIREGKQIHNLKENVPPWQVLHMTLFEVTLPELRAQEESAKTLSELVSMMEQLYAGMQSARSSKHRGHYAIEIAVAEGSDDIVFYCSVPDAHIDLFEKQLLSLYPHATLTKREHDYNIFVEKGANLLSVAQLQRHPLYPLKTKEEFESDPMAVLLNAFSKIEREGGGASLQLLIRNAQSSTLPRYESVMKRVREGVGAKDALARSSLSGELLFSVKDMVFSSKTKKESDPEVKEVDQEALELFTQKIATPLVETTIRIAVSATQKERAQQILSEIEATFNQFERTRSNKLVFKQLQGSALARELRAFSFREFSPKYALSLSMRELSSLLHFPQEGVITSPQFKQSRAKTAAAENDMPQEGTLLGVNVHRGSNREIYITPEDRLRHFYIIGQTGTGKTTLMKNMIIQDIHAGDGVCFIDPHGSDIADVLGAIPKEREADVIYFDPASTESVIGLNMLEYDERFPEQKTFVVNELFSIFQKLYGANPESIGPMFEQYFRNATLLVMEDPHSGNTLMDISRVMSDSAYRAQKLEHAQNPVVKQFWQEIATKAGGEAALENIVPYIVSKFDVFTANDYMRPIIGVQQSSFNFRQIMDERKILLVNLSKGRIGEINANLLGMIIVGKLLMAALSRVDDPSKQFAPFYLHMDEFQNISTNSIAAILSEARKYKLGLTVAHQFIAQLDERIKDAVFGNVGSLAAFRVGPDDAQFLEHQFEPTFTANDLMNIPNRIAYMRTLANGTPSRPFSMETLPPSPTDEETVSRIIGMSNAKYGRAKADVEAEIMTRYQQREPQIPQAPSMM